MYFTIIHNPVEQVHNIATVQLTLSIVVSMNVAVEKPNSNYMGYRRCNIQIRGQKSIVDDSILVFRTLGLCTEINVQRFPELISLIHCNIEPSFYYKSLYVLNWYFFAWTYIVASAWHLEGPPWHGWWLADSKSQILTDLELTFL